jgi:hypothetical protein
MLPTTVLIDATPRCVVRPTDAKALSRFIRNGRDFLLTENPNGTITHRSASNDESAKWYNAFALHKAWGGDEEAFFGVPL